MAIDDPHNGSYSLITQVSGGTSKPAETTETSDNGWCSVTRNLRSSLSVSVDFVFVSMHLTSCLLLNSLK